MEDFVSRLSSAGLGRSLGGELGGLVVRLLLQRERKRIRRQSSAHGETPSFGLWSVKKGTFPFVFCSAGALCSPGHSRRLWMPGSVSHGRLAAVEGVAVCCPACSGLTHFLPSELI